MKEINVHIPFNICPFARGSKGKNSARTRGGGGEGEGGTERAREQLEKWRSSSAQAKNFLRVCVRVVGGLQNMQPSLGEKRLNQRSHNACLSYPCRPPRAEDTST